MTAKESGPKGALTVRLKPTKRTELDALAETSNRSVSSLVEQAIEEFLSRQLSRVALASDPSLDASDIERLLPVAKAADAPLPLKIILAIVEAQRASKA